MTCATPTQAFKKDTHQNVTQKVLRNNRTKAVFGVTYRFSDRAIRQISSANTDTDCFPDCQQQAAWHFDDEAILAGSSRLKALREGVIERITAPSPDGATARKLLGGALHTLQDYYAHTNWVDQGTFFGIDPLLGREAFPGAFPETHTCSSVNYRLDTDLLARTSGYFRRPTTCSAPQYKCVHGLPSGLCLGIAKDEPSHPLYSRALDEAGLATADFLKQILDDSRVADNPKAVAALMDARGDLGMVVDVSASMAPELPAVKEQIRRMVQEVVRKKQEPSGYRLEMFGESGISLPFRTADAAAFLDAVAALTPESEPERQCPGSVLSALSMATTNTPVPAMAPANSQFFVFTDATSDPVEAEAGFPWVLGFVGQGLGFQYNFVTTGSCSPVDPAYVSLSAETGGSLLVLDEAEADRIYDLVRPQLSEDSALLAFARGVLAPGPRELPVPVDSTVTEAAFWVRLEARPSVVLLRPSGVPVAGGDADASITEVAAGTAIAISNPESGTWRLRVSGSGAFSAEARASTPLQFDRFDFAEEGGRLGHGGFMPIQGRPLGGVEQIGLATVFGSVSSVRFRLLDEAGNLLKEVFLDPNPAAAEDEFVGSFVPPAVPFRVAVTGVDTAALPFQRLYPTVFRTQPIALRVAEALPSLKAGATSTVTLEVRNTGAADTLELSASADPAWVGRVEPAALVLPADGSKRVEVDLTVPAGTPVETNLSLTVTAKSQSDPQVESSAQVSMITSDNTAPTANAGADRTLTCAGPNGTTITLDGAASSDPDGDFLGYTWTGPFPEGNGTVGGVTPTVTLFPGPHTITLVVDDGRGGTASDQVDVTIACGVNQSPVADAGPDQVVSCAGPAGTPVLLDGSGSYDPDADPLTYVWTGPFPEGGGVALGVRPSVTLSPGSHTLTLTLNDGRGGTATDSALVTVFGCSTGLDVAWFSVDGGGAVGQSASAWTLSGTIGQPDASQDLPSSRYSLRGGFWVVPPNLGGFFYTLTPCRLIDTRDPDGTYGGPALAAGADRVFPLYGRCHIPSSAKAVSVNLTVAGPTAPGHLRLYPAGMPLPNTSSINYPAGLTRANNAIVSLSALGELAVRCAQGSGSTHFVLDVNGYFE